MQKTSPFLTELSASQKEAIEEARSFGLGPKQISEQLGLNYEDVKYYVDCLIDSERTHFERLKAIVDDLEDQCKSTKAQLDEGDASAMMLQSYQRLMAEYRLALADLMGLRKPQDALDEVMDKAFKPFITSLIQACTEETHNLKEEMLKLDVNPRDAKGISTEVFRRLSDRVSNILPETKQALYAHFGIKASKAKEKVVVQ